MGSKTLKDKVVNSMSKVIKSAEEWVNIIDEVFKEMEKKYGSYRREDGSGAFEDIRYVADLHIKAKEYSLKLGDLDSL